MKQDILFRRILLARLRPPSPLTFSRSFAHHAPSGAGPARPQLPFLTMPAKKETIRYFTTEKKRWLKEEAKLVARYMIGLWGVLIGGTTVYWLVMSEVSERDYPTPHEWSFISRMHLRNMKLELVEPSSGYAPDWVRIMDVMETTIKRLQDPKLDGKGIEEIVEGSIYVDGVGKMGYDISSMSENWRRGYYEVMMLAARAAEHVDGWVTDKKRKLVVPPDVVIGPSNPNPKPIPFGAPSAPVEDDCEPAFEPAENYYLRILTTKGFTRKQKMDAALAYAAFMDFKALPEPAERMYQWALSLATEGIPDKSLPYDRRTLVLNDNSPPSENVLTALTAMATHKATNGDVSNALPIFVSLLKTRKGLSSEPPETTRRWSASVYDQIMQYLKEAPYPDPPPDGNSPPSRNPQELCEEGALGLYIGEMLFASSDREQGLAWTRDAVEVAEEQLREMQARRVADKAAKKTCRECLSTGLYNWSSMAATLAQMEEAKAKESARGSGFVFWRSSRGKAETPGRWKAEEEVVKDRIRRTTELLEDLQKPREGLLSRLLKV